MGRSFSTIVRGSSGVRFLTDLWGACGMLTKTPDSKVLEDGEKRIHLSETDLNTAHSGLVRGRGGHRDEQNDPTKLTYMQHGA